MLKVSKYKCIKYKKQKKKSAANIIEGIGFVLYCLYCMLVKILISKTATLPNKRTYIIGIKFL